MVLISVWGRFLAWVAYMQTAVLIGTLALALFNASKDQIARNFAYAYSALSVAVLVCALPPLLRSNLTRGHRCMAMLFTSIVLR